MATANAFIFLFHQPVSYTKAVAKRVEAKGHASMMHLHVRRGIESQTLSFCGKVCLAMNGGQRRLLHVFLHTTVIPVQFEYWLQVRDRIQVCRPR